MIKRATIDDIDKLAVMGVKCLNDLPNYSTAKCDPEHTRKQLLLYIGIPDMAIFYKEDEQGEIVGVLMGIVAAPWFTSDKEMSEIMFWVREDYRKSRLAFELIKVMEEWAITAGAKKIIMAAASGYETKRVEKLYNWLGYQSNAIQCCKEVK